MKKAATGISLDSGPTILLFNLQKYDHHISEPVESYDRDTFLNVKGYFLMIKLNKLL
jgi:hypothetical protein